MGAGHSENFLMSPYYYTVVGNELETEELEAQIYGNGYINNGGDDASWGNKLAMKNAVKNNLPRFRKPPTSFPG